MKYRHAVFVACSPLLGIASAGLLTLLDADATNLFEGGGLVNTAGLLSMFWGILGWYLTLPLAAVMVAITWSQRAARRTQLRHVNRRGEDPPEGLTRAERSLWLLENSRRDGHGGLAPPAS
jgi:hypothetical protein